VLGVSRNQTTIDTRPDKVWDVLSDGWLYPLWVVGATRMRAVDDTWPDPGSKLHHSAGVWPLALDDTTEVVECEPERFLRVLARGWPLGEAEVRVTLTGLGGRTTVELEEQPVKGPGALIPKPIYTPLLTWRNVESLRRLAFLVEGRAR
jgi:uncharacterized protein YndB with AHSA1/START domain